MLLQDLLIFKSKKAEAALKLSAEKAAMVLQQQEILPLQQEVLHHPKEPVLTEEPTKAEKRLQLKKLS